ncbi:MAG: Rpn family recombination-promoting nuclease/putative transposase [Polyangiaceae bacterium]
MSRRPHDNLVRDVFGHPEHARGELQHLLPAELSARLDWSTLTLVPGSFVDEALEESQSDLLFSVRLKGDDRTAYLYLLLEHQSSPDPLLVFRQLKYQVRFLHDWLEDHPGATRLPVVIPLLLCHAPTAWSGATRFEDLLDIDPSTRPLVLDFVPRFRLLVDDLTTQPDEALRVRAMTEMGRLVLWCLKTARSPDELVAGMKRWKALLRAVRQAPHGIAAVALIWRYLLVVHDQPEERILLALEAALDQEQKEDMASIADQLVEKGIRKGRAEGRVEGRVEGREEGTRAVVLRLLQRRFGTLPDDVRGRVEHATLAELDELADRVLTAATLDEVVNPLG